ncbi:MAG: hypothetical protein U1C58_06295 [Flavobacteriaceae bacterium]|nr:hypothetical protein [Flavobacteriaceae bacterium]
MNYLFHNVSLRIVIADKLWFNACKSIRIDKSVQVLTDSAKIELPREFKNAIDVFGQPVDISGKSILDFIRRDDPISILIGYDGDLETEFQGYITKIGADTPLLIECEDEMSRLKKAPRVTKSVKSGKLIDILKAILPAKYKVECNQDYAFGTWLIDLATPYEVLEQLKEKVGIRAYFKDATTLKVGMMIDFEPQTTHDFNFSENVRRDTDLKFELKEDRLLEVTAKSKQKNGQEITYTKGDKGGDTITLKLPQLSKAELKIWADRTHASRSFTGFEGSLNGWCYPRTKPGDAAKIVRPFYPDRHQDGKYFIESVSIEVSESAGIKRTNKLSYKL